MYFIAKAEMELILENFIRKCQISCACALPDKIHRNLSSSTLQMKFVILYEFLQNKFASQLVRQSTYVDALWMCIISKNSRTYNYCVIGFQRRGSLHRIFSLKVAIAAEKLTDKNKLNMQDNRTDQHTVM